MRLLAASDIHIGRIPALPGKGPGATARSAWEAVVQCALDREVDALLLAGDVVQGDLAWFEARGPLLAGLRRLADRGIPVVAVAGNHDAQVFPGLVREAPGLTLLGLHGTWTATDLGGLRIAGWSFPGPAFAGNPLATFDEEALTGGRPYLGLLHCDVDASSGPYAPVPGRALEATRAGHWVLGHVHKGGLRAGGRAFYCGSPHALDAGEEGDHGAWLLDVDAGGSLAAPEHLPLSPWVFKTLTVDLDQVATVEDARDRLAQALDRAALAQAGLAPWLFCSFRCVGATALAGNVDALFREALPALTTTLEGVTARPTGRLLDATEPLLDLPALAGKRGLKGSLARLLLQARNPGAPLEELPGVLAAVSQLHPGGRATAEEARAALALAACRLLTVLDRQERGA